jgi:hypothetical protein
MLRRDFQEWHDAENIFIVEIYFEFLYACCHVEEI